MSDKVMTIDFSEEGLLESAAERFEDGDFLGALEKLNLLCEWHGGNADVYAMYAEIYEELGQDALCADAWFRFLDTCNEADFSEGYEGLILAFTNMGDLAHANIYLIKLIEAGDSANLQSFPFLKGEPGDFLHFAHTEDGKAESEFAFREGIKQLQVGDYTGAREFFSGIDPRSERASTAAGFSALSFLLEGKGENALEECKRLLKLNPDDAQMLAAYCTVLHEMGRDEEAVKTAKQIAALELTSLEDVLRAGTVMCELGLDEEAFHILGRLQELMPNALEVIWFHAVAAFRSGRLEEAISLLETYTQLNPHKEIAKHYLTLMRKRRDDPDVEIEIGYIYRLSQNIFKECLELLAESLKMSEKEAKAQGEAEDFCTALRLVLEDSAGKNEEAILIAAQAAVKCRCDAVLRDFLLDFRLADSVKEILLRELLLRNEENSFGIVMCDVYKELFLHEIDVGLAYCDEFLFLFAEVYAKYAWTQEDNGEGLVSAAEEIYHSLEDEDEIEYLKEESAIKAVILREARVAPYGTKLDLICDEFGADPKTVRQILTVIG